MQVIKRDSRKKEFISERISNVVGKAFIEVFERDKKGELDKEIDKIINAVSEQTNSNGNLDGSKRQ